MLLFSFLVLLRHVHARHARPGAARERPAIASRLRLSLDASQLDFDVSAAARGVTALFGASGSGKTTCCAASPGSSTRA